MSTSYDAWKTEAPDLHEPDPAPDTETYPEVVEMVKAAVYEACESGNPHYEGKISRLVNLFQCATAILNMPEIRDQIAAGDYAGAADDVLWHIDYRFGKNFRSAGRPMPDRPFFHDPNLVALVTWLQKRERPQ